MVQEYSLAPGFDNTAGFVVLESTAVSGIYFISIQGVGSYDPGEEVPKLSGIIDDVGEAAFEWLFTRLTFAQYDWLIATPNAGARSNRVTARTRFGNTTYHNVNAIMTVPKVKGTGRTFGSYTDVVVPFKIVEILS